MAPKRFGRSAEDLANEHAKKSLKLRENVARERVVACMRFEPACVSSLLESLRDCGTLARYAVENPPKHADGLLALEDDPDSKHTTPRRRSGAENSSNNGQPSVASSSGQDDGVSSYENQDSPGDVKRMMGMKVQTWIPHCYTTIADSATVRSGLSEPYLVHIASMIEPVSCSQLSLQGLRDKTQKRIPRERLLHILERMTGMDMASVAITGQLRHLPSLVAELDRLILQNRRPLRGEVITKPWAEIGEYILHVPSNGLSAVLTGKTNGKLVDLQKDLFKDVKEFSFHMVTLSANWSVAKACLSVKDSVHSENCQALFMEKPQHRLRKKAAPKSDGPERLLAIEGPIVPVLDVVRAAKKIRQTKTDADDNPPPPPPA